MHLIYLGHLCSAISVAIKSLLCCLINHLCCFSEAYSVCLLPSLELAEWKSVVALVVASALLSGRRLNGIGTESVVTGMGGNEMDGMGQASVTAKGIVAAVGEATGVAAAIVMKAALQAAVMIAGEIVVRTAGKMLTFTTAGLAMTASEMVTIAMIVERVGTVVNRVLVEAAPADVTIPVDATMETIGIVETAVARVTGKTGMVMVTEVIAKIVGIVSEAVVEVGAEVVRAAVLLEAEPVAATVEAIVMVAAVIPAAVDVEKHTIVVVAAVTVVGATDSMCAAIW